MLKVKYFSICFMLTGFITDKTNTDAGIDRWQQYEISTSNNHGITLLLMAGWSQTSHHLKSDYYLLHN